MKAIKITTDSAILSNRSWLKYNVVDELS